MVGQDGGLPGGGVDVGVDLRGEDGLVAEHLLDDPQVRPAFDEVGGEGVAEGVREISLWMPAAIAWSFTTPKI